MKVNNIYTNQQLINEAIKFNTRKRLGQNFLVDIDKLVNIANLLDVTQYNLIVEIGCGLGFLTRFLSNETIPTIAIDLDPRCVKYVNRLKLPLTTAIEANALDFDFNKLANKNIIIFGNIPYQITTPLIAHIFGELGSPKSWQTNIKTVVFTIQFEVAQRLLAKPGASDYSALTILANYYNKISFVQEIKQKYFYPSPKVNSATVLMQPVLDPEVKIDNPNNLRKIVQLGFKQRRKMLKNTLASLNLGITQIESIFQDLDIDLSARSQDLSLKQFNDLTQKIYINKK